VDCRDDFDDTQLVQQFIAGMPGASGLLVLWNGVPDDGVPKPPAWFDRTLQFALPALSQPHTRVYAHCAAGINRGPSSTYAILRALGLTAEAAEKMIRDVRPQVALAYKADADKAVEEGWL
jgi:protein-tyrosine phosphatase